MFYVYLLVSKIDSRQKYIGLTQNLKTRLTAHNAGKSVHTNKFKPWKIETCIAFADRTKAEKFETYLKQGSDHAFAKKHFW